MLLIAELQARPDSLKEVAALLDGLTNFAATEPGCLSYAYYYDSAAQDRLIVVERYLDRAACDSHIAAEPVQNALKRFETLLTEAPSLRFGNSVPNQS